MEIIETLLNNPKEQFKNYGDDEFLCRNPVHQTIPYNFDKSATKESVQKILIEKCVYVHYAKQRLAQFQGLKEFYAVFCTKKEGFATTFIIPQTSKTTFEIFHNLNAIQNGIKIFKEMGLIIEYDSYYSQKKHIAKKYLWNWHVSDILDEICLDYEIPTINPWEKKIKYSQDLYEYYESKNIEFNSNLRIPIKGTKQEYEAIIKDILHKKYPILKTLESNVKELNKLLRDIPEAQTRAQINIRISSRKRITGISIRAYSPFCNSKKLKKLLDAELEKPDPALSLYGNFELNRIDIKDAALNVQKEYGEAIRENIQKKYNLSNNYDVSGSVPRLTSSLNCGCYQTQIGSFYAEIKNEIKNIINEDLKNLKNGKRFEHFNTLMFFESEVLDFVNSEKFDKILSKEFLKKLYMRANFSPSQAYMAAKILNYSDEMLPDLKKDLVYYYSDVYYRATQKVQGSSFGSVIFLFESLLMTDIQLQLNKSGNKTFLIYDEIVTEKSLGSVAIKDQILNELLSASFEKNWSDIKQTLINIGAYNGYDVNAAIKNLKSDESDESFSPKVKKLPPRNKKDRPFQDQSFCFSMNDLDFNNEMKALPKNKKDQLKDIGKYLNKKINNSNNLKNFENISIEKSKEKISDFELQKIGYNLIKAIFNVNTKIENLNLIKLFNILKYKFNNNIDSITHTNNNIISLLLNVNYHFGNNEIPQEFYEFET